MKNPHTNTIPQLLLDRVKKSPKEIAHYALTSNGKWEPTTWETFFDLSTALAGTLKEMGVCEGQNIGIMAASSQNWDMFQMAVFMCGGVVVGIDPHDLDENIGHITQTVSLSGLLVEKTEMLKKFSQETTAGFRFITSVEPPAEDAENIVSLKDLIQRGKGKRLAGIDKSKGPLLATIIFTSGSTGAPKGVCYTHEQVSEACSAILAAFPSIGEGRRFVCWLPLSNLFQRIINFCAMNIGAETYFVENPREIMRHLPTINPHIFLGVPRFFEKLYEGTANEIKKKPLWMRSLISSALRAGDDMAKARRMGKVPGFLPRIVNGFLEPLVLKRLRGVLGNSISFMISGSAPMPLWLLQRFHAMGLLILEAYGVSENVIPNTMNRLEDFRFETVGKPLLPNRVEIAEDGEILVKGPGVFRGYLGKTYEDAPFDKNGFLKTGDIGAMDENGFLTITGRKSEIFKTSTGRKIAPVGIEERIMRVPHVDHAVVLGAGKKYVVAILAMNGWELKKDPAFFSRQHIDRIKNDVRSELTSLPEYRKPAGLVLCPEPFSIKGGELTGNLKIKRSQVHKKFGSSVEALYSFLDSSEKSEQGLLETEHGTILVKL